MTGFTIVAFYKFTHLPDYVSHRQPLSDACTGAGVFGTILIASEGINGTIFTGLQPNHHGVRNNGRYQLAEEHTTLAEILSERPVYLRSRLNRNAVEELGLGFVETSDEVLRIAEPHSDCLLIRDAHKCQIKARESADEPEGTTT